MDTRGRVCQTPHRIGVIGLGNMGSGMATRLLAAKYQVSVWNRTRLRARAHAATGARTPVSPRALARRCELIVIAVHDVAALRSVLFGPQGAFSGARPGTIFVDTSTVSPAASMDLAKRAERIECAYLDAPVLGGRDAALQGRLQFLVGGPQQAFRRARPVLRVLGYRAVWIGPSGCGSSVKLAHNAVAGSTMGALAEGLTVARAAGVETATVARALERSIIASRFLRAKMRKIVLDDFSPVARLALYAKDLASFCETARSVGAPVPVAEAVHAQLRSAARRGQNDADVCALYRSVAGLAARRASRSASTRRSA